MVPKSRHYVGDWDWVIYDNCLRTIIAFISKLHSGMGCATSQTEDKAEFLDVGDVLVQFDPTTGGAAPSTFQAIRVKVLRANKLIKADSKAHTHDPLIVYPSRYTPPYDASALHITLPMCMRTPTLSGLLRVPNPPHRRTTHTLSFSPPSPVRRGRSHRQVRPVRGGARGCDGPLVPRKGRGRGPRVDDEDDRQQRGPGLGRGVHAGI